MEHPYTSEYNHSQIKCICIYSKWNSFWRFLMSSFIWSLTIQFSIKENSLIKIKRRKEMSLYLKLLLLLSLLALASLKLMLASDVTKENSLSNKNLNRNHQSNHKLYKPEANSYLGTQKLSTTMFGFHDNSCSMLYWLWKNSYLSNIKTGSQLCYPVF